MMFQLDELHPIYQSVDHDVAVIIANLGAMAYCSSRDTLHEHWTKAMSEEDNIKMEKWKSVGYGNAVEEYRERLQEADALKAKLAEVSGELAKMNASIEDIAQSRVASVIDGVRKECEYAKIQELSELREQLAITAMQKQLLDALQFKIQTVEEQRDALQERLLEQTVAATKSSHAIGKMGEASVFEMLNSIVPQLPHASVKDTTAVSHAADFHLWVMGENGKKVKLLIDAKKYKRKITCTEIEKLHSDIDGDEDAHGGMLVSLETDITAKYQFQIGQTVKRKPVMYLSFTNVDEELRRNMLLWGIRTLAEFSALKSEEESDHMITNIKEFLEFIDGCVKDIDGGIRNITKAADGFKVIRDSIVKQLIEFRIGNSSDTVEEVDVETCPYVKRSGYVCGDEIYERGMCKRHSKTKKAMEVAGGGS